MCGDGRYGVELLYCGLDFCAYSAANTGSCLVRAKTVLDLGFNLSGSAPLRWPGIPRYLRQRGRFNLLLDVLAFHDIFAACGGVQVASRLLLVGRLVNSVVRIGIRRLQSFDCFIVSFWRV